MYTEYDKEVGNRRKADPTASPGKDLMFQIFDSFSKEYDSAVLRRIFRRCSAKFHHDFFLCDA
jgi:hypothetical protein